MNMEGGWKLKFVFYFMQTMHESLHLQLQINFGILKYHGYNPPTSFIWIIILFDEAFKYCDNASL
jgi:hypothetical protein